MLVRAKVNFSGAISMCAGDVRDIKDEYILHDLLNAGYVEPEAQEAEIVVKPVQKAEPVSEEPEKESKSKKTRKKSK